LIDGSVDDTLCKLMFYLLTLCTWSTRMVQVIRR